MKEEKFDFEAFKKEAMRKLRDKEPGVTAENLFKPLFKKFIEEAKKLNMWSIVRNYSSWRESFNNNENIINIINKAIKNAKNRI